MKDIHAVLAQRRQASLYRQRLVRESPQAAYVQLAGVSYLSFCSNDYLGLANDPRLIQSLQDAAREHGVGSGAAHLVSGHSKPHHQLEEALADFLGYERALLFSTGYMANLGVISALMEESDVVLEDKLNHASLIDGARLAHATLKRYLHADVDSLRKHLDKLHGAPCLVASDGVFSMDGDIAPLRDIADLCQRQRATLMIDDAHGLGVIGANGRGSLSHCGLTASDAPLLVGTLGKAFGTFGAFVAASAPMIEALIQLSRTYIYTTALPPAIAQATLTSLAIVKEETWRREHLHKLIMLFRRHASELGLQLGDSITPIQPILIGEAQSALHLSQALKERGILIPAIRPPTVPVGSARLRITFSAQHSEDDVMRLLDALTHLHVAQPQSRSS